MGVDEAQLQSVRVQQGEVGVVDPHSAQAGDDGVAECGRSPHRYHSDNRLPLEAQRMLLLSCRERSIREWLLGPAAPGCTRPHGTAPPAKHECHATQPTHPAVWGPKQLDVVLHRLPARPIRLIVVQVVEALKEVSRTCRVSDLI